MALQASMNVSPLAGFASALSSLVITASMASLMMRSSSVVGRGSITSVCLVTKSTWLAFSWVGMIPHFLFRASWRVR